MRVTVVVAAPPASRALSDDPRRHRAALAVAREPEQVVEILRCALAGTAAGATTPR